MVNGKTEPDLLNILEAIHGFLLHFRQRISRDQQICVQVDAAVCGKSYIADLISRLEGPTQQLAASPNVFRPGHHVTCEDHVGPGMEPRQAASVDQIKTQLAKSKSDLVAAEVRSGYLAKPHIGNTRCIAVAPLQA